MKPIRISREKKQLKSTVICIRMKESDRKRLEGLKNSMEFDTIKDLLLYSAKVVDKIRKWQNDGYKFVRKHRSEGNTEIIFDMEP